MHFMLWPQESRIVHTAHMPLQNWIHPPHRPYQTAPTWKMNAVQYADAVAIQGAMSVYSVAGAVCMQ